MSARLTTASTLCVFVLGHLVSGLGCGDNLPEPPPPTPPPSQLDSPKSKAEMYGSDRVWDIDIELSPAAEQDLRLMPREYVLASVTIGETRIENVGVRLKGKFSFQNLDGKPSFKIKFDEYIFRQRFSALNKLTLNNMRQDRSQVHEWLSYRVFRELQIPAPRSSFVNVSVNGTPYGLYANVETLDSEFLADHYDDPTGNLYEAPWTADLNTENVSKFEQDEGTDLSREDLDRIVDQLAAEDDRAFFGAGAAVDTTQFLRFMTAETIVGHWDGYWKSNNYFLYSELSTGKWTWLPWGLDQSWDRTLDPFTSGGFVAQKCLDSAACSRAYSEVALDSIDRIDWTLIEEELDSLTEMLTEHIESDQRSPQPAAKAIRFQQIARHQVATASQRLWPKLDCYDDEDTTPIDRDEDTFAGCQLDCDDMNDSVYPGAEEVCDGLDNDCDGQVDEVLCPCIEHTIDGREFIFCQSQVPWTVAERLCLQHRAVLAAEGDATRSALLFEQAKRLDPNASWFIGANDRSDEGIWVDSEDTAIEPLFAPGEPDDFGGQDCVVLASHSGGAWADDHCTAVRPFICELGK